MRNFWARVHWCSHVSHHHQSSLLGLVECIHLALEIVLLEHQGFAMDLRLTVLTIEVCKLEERKDSSFYCTAF